MRSGRAWCFLRLVLKNVVEFIAVNLIGDQDLAGFSVRRKLMDDHLFKVARRFQISSQSRLYNVGPKQIAQPLRSSTPIILLSLTNQMSRKLWLGFD